MHKRVLVSLLAAVALLAFVAGCGDDDGDTGGGEQATLTKAEFIDRGDRICEKWEQRSETEAEEFAEEKGFDLEDPDKEQLEEAITEVLVPALNQQAEEIEALDAPEGDGERVEEIVTALESAADEVEEEPSRAFEGHTPNEAGELAETTASKSAANELTDPLAKRPGDRYMLRGRWT